MFKGILSHFAAPCVTSDPNFFDLPTWYRYLEKETINGRCEIVNFGFEDIPLIGLALIDIGLRIAALVAIGYIIYGGIQFVVAQGEADKTKKARQTIINALIGLVIALFATAIVTFIGSSIT
jgi:hypothetical protein